MAKEVVKEKFPTWGPESELNFVKGLGGHRQSYATERSEREWLELYVAAHKKSPHSHHKAGVKYARGRLNG